VYNENPRKTVRISEDMHMEFLQDPNITYLLLAGGLIFAVLSLAAPGTGVLEVGAIAILAIAGWSIIAYNLPINVWALILLILGGVVFSIAVFRHKPWPLLILSIIAIVFGSAYLFRGEAWYIPAVNPFLATVIALLSGSFFWIAGRKVAEAALVRPTHDLDNLVGEIGKTMTPVHHGGSVQVASELWSARSEQPIRKDQSVRVIDRQGFTLLVEPFENEK